MSRNVLTLSSEEEQTVMSEGCESCCGAALGGNIGNTGTGYALWIPGLTMSGARRSCQTIEGQLVKWLYIRIGLV